MASLEEKLQPTITPRPWLCEMLGAGLLIAVTSVLLIGWHVQPQQHFMDVVGSILGFGLLPSLGFVLALRCGAIDLSVWSVSALGGVVAVEATRFGMGPCGAMLTAGVAGTLVGAIHGLLIGKLKLPSIVVTLASALILMWALRAAYNGRSIAAPEKMFVRWLSWIPAGGPRRPWLPWAGKPPFVLRMALVSLTYSLTVSVLAGFVLLDRLIGHRRNRLRRFSLVAAMCSSGLLASLGGAMWLVEHGSTPIPTRPIGDLRIVAAALLSGAILFGGQGRALLAAVALPPATLAASTWWLRVANLPAGGFHMQMWLLIGMTIVTHLAILHISSHRNGTNKQANWSVALTVVGMVILASAAIPDTYVLRRLCHAVGIASWIGGAVLLMAARASVRSAKLVDGC